MEAELKGYLHEISLWFDMSTYETDVQHSVLSNSLGVWFCLPAVALATHRFKLSWLILDYECVHHAIEEAVLLEG
ncbi:hypothetical protein Nepgr_030327 [Nepenthes gracilis]|uniref:Uncharacterized protein n=1 Tax=Nepenthes gracilis TaxID=150966 RepID=A0AAD3Y5Y6_NEPGR|nr:hypothetical protein Nepgr_030327 [Nepenthes gracilis]